MENIYFLALSFLAIIIYYLLFAFNISRKYCVISEQAQTEKTVNYFSDIPLYKSLNLGAFLLLPLWLFVNVFWLTLILYFVALVNYWPAALFLSFFYLLFGSRLSWGNGERWNYNLERFLDSQSMLSFMAIVIVIVNVVVIGFNINK